MLSAPRRDIDARQRGYALLVVLAFAVVGGLYGLAGRLGPLPTKLRQQQATSAALKLAQEALIGHAATYRDTHAEEMFGYLPCPDLSGTGIEELTCGNSGQPAVGLLPYRSLGLADLRDADGNCLWYAVSGGFKNNPKAAPLNWDSQGQFSVVDAAGKSLVAPDDAGGGAAAIVFAPGPPLAAQSRSAGPQPCGVAPAEVAAYLEGGGNRYVHGESRDGAGDLVANDRLAWIAPREIFARVLKRGDFAAFVANGINRIQAKLNQAPRPGGNGDGLPAANPFDRHSETSDANFYDNWKDQFRYLPCAAPASYCYGDGGTQRYDGVLLFGGATADGSPRPATARSLADYFEPPLLAVAQGQAFQPCSATPAVFDTAAGRAADIALCLWPQPQVVAQSIDTSDPAQFARLSPVVSARPLVRRDDANRRLQLGQTGITGSGAAAAPLYGCIWLPTALTLGALEAPISLRATFSFYIDNAGDGFTFTVADAARNPVPAMCGASGANLGYAGSNGSTASIAAPKLAIEVDRHCDAAYGDPACSSTYRQLAFVYWGEAANGDDDNSHGRPPNPASGSTGFKKSTSSSFLGDRRMQYLRFEMQRTYDAAAHRARHELRAYLTHDLGAAGCLSDDFYDLDDDIANISPFCFGAGPTIADTLVIDDSDGAPAMQNVWIGFTNGQGSQDQRIYVYNLRVRAGP